MTKTDFIDYKVNYKRIYDQIIERAKSELRVKTPTGIYYERHHIIPKCMGGLHNKDNLVLLTAREHVLAHWLLAEIYNHDSLWYAFKMMCDVIKGWTKRTPPSIRIIAYARLKYIEILKRRKFSPEVLKRRGESISKANKGKRLSAERKKIAINNVKKVWLSAQKPVIQSTLDDKFIKEYSSIKEAVKETKIFNVGAACRGIQKKAGNFKWKFKNK